MREGSYNTEAAAVQDAAVRADVGAELDPCAGGCGREATGSTYGYRTCESCSDSMLDARLG